MNTNWSIYDFYNLGEKCRKEMLEDGFGFSFKYFKDIINTKISMFSYKNLDKAVKDLTDSILESAICFSSRLCFYKDSNLGVILCRYSDDGTRSIYNTPISVNLSALNGSYIKSNVPYNDIILVRDNRLDIVPYIVIKEYIYKMKWLEDANAKIVTNATLPLAIIGSKKQAAALKAVASKLGSSDPFFIGDDSIIDQVKGFNIDVPVTPQEIFDLRMKYKNECLSSLGIYNVDEKRERVVTQELVNKNDYADYVYQSCKMERERFCEELSELTGVNVELVETYDINYEENTELESDRKYEDAKAEAEGEVKGNPDVNKEVGNNE